MKVCLYCGEENTKRLGSKFCSDKCKEKFRWTKRYCKECNEELTGTVKKRFCSARCQQNWWAREKTRQNQVWIKKKCPTCNTEFETTNHKRFCDKNCQNIWQVNIVKAERQKVNDKYRQKKFEEFAVEENDLKDLVLRDLFERNFQEVSLKSDMRYHGVVARINREKRNTIRGVFNIKVNVINVKELIDLYNLKIESFRKAPQKPKETNIINLAKLIKKARLISNETNI